MWLLMKNQHNPRGIDFPDKGRLGTNPVCASLISQRNLLLGLIFLNKKILYSPVMGEF
jgi:hypothetical protein